MEYYAIITNNTLSHHGIKDMTWGHRRAKWYPIAAYEDHLRRMGYSERQIKKRYAKAEKGEAKYQKYVAKNRAKNLAKAKKARDVSIAKKKEREEIIRTGDINRALERIDDFTNEELKTIRERNQAKIAIAQAKTDAMLGKLGTISNVTNKMANIASDGTKIYNTVAKIANAFGDTDFPILGENKNNNQDNNQKTEKKKENVQQTSKKKDSSNQNNQDEKEKLNKKIDDDIEDRIKKMDKANAKDAKEAEKTRKAEQKLREENAEPEHVSGDVVDERTSKEEKAYRKAEKTVEDIIIDVDWKDITPTDIRKGEEYIQKALPHFDYPLLEYKKK